MPDNLTPEDRRKTMKAVKGKNTGLERRLFAMLAGMGVSGWKKNAANVLGKPDVVFPEARIAIFVDGCFWHGCPHCNRRLPESNRDYWVRKIQRNIQRDRTNRSTLRNEGWTVISIWEHSMHDPQARKAVRAEIGAALKSNAVESMENQQ